MKARLAASVVFAAALLATTAGCGFVTPQATLIHYDPSDGVGAKVGDIELRNVLALTDDGTDVSLVITAINTGETSASLALQYEDSDGAKQVKTIVVPADSTLTYGNADQDALQLLFADATPGALMPIYFQYGKSAGTEVLAPVLDGTLPQYAEVMPSK